MKDSRGTMEGSRMEGRPHMLQNGLGCRRLGFRQAQYSPLLSLDLGEVFGVRRSSMLLTPSQVTSGPLASEGFPSKGEKAY